MKKLTRLAQTLRTNATQEENTLWYQFLRRYPLQWHPHFLSRVAWGLLRHRHKDSPYTSDAEEMRGNPQEPEAAAQLSGRWGCDLDMATARAELPSLVESL